VVFSAIPHGITLPAKASGGVMVWIGGPRGRGGGRTKALILHDPPPGYRPPRRRMPLRERQRRARRDWILEHVLAVILILTAGAFLVIMLIMLATRL
jgi:hypothetical protein